MLTLTTYTKGDAEETVVPALPSLAEALSLAASLIADGDPRFAKGWVIPTAIHSFVVEDDETGRVVASGWMPG